MLELQRRGACALALSIAVVVAGCGDKSPEVSSRASSGSETGGKQVVGQTCSAAGGASDAHAVAKARTVLEKAAGTTSSWDGPTTGPPAQKQGATIIFVPQTETNDGDLGVEKGFKEAAKALGWNVKVIDGGGAAASSLAALDQAIALKPDGVMVSSFDPKAAQPAFARAKKLGIHVVANHTGFDPGPQESAPDLFTNITSDPATIATVAASCAIVASAGTAGVTIVGCESEVVICLTKENAMKASIGDCPGCELLAQHDFPFADAQQRYGGIASADVQRFGPKLTYMLSINDIYYDAAIPAVKALGAKPSGPPLMIAAGDGSQAAFKRVRQGEYQIATVAEPLNLHGWQMADEMNRAFAGEPESGYVTYPHITTKENVDSEGGDRNTYDPDSGYRDEYRKIWGVG